MYISRSTANYSLQYENQIINLIEKGGGDDLSFPFLLRERVKMQEGNISLGVIEFTFHWQFLEQASLFLRRSIVWSSGIGNYLSLSLSLMHTEINLRPAFFFCGFLFLLARGEMRAFHLSSHLIGQQQVQLPTGHCFSRSINQTTGTGLTGSLTSLYRLCHWCRRRIRKVTWPTKSNWQTHNKNWCSKTGGSIMQRSIAFLACRKSLEWSKRENEIELR